MTTVFKDISVHTQEQHEELLKAAIAMVEAKPNDSPANWEQLWRDLENAIKPFMLLSIAGRLDEVRSRVCMAGSNLDDAINDLIAEIRELEK